MPMKKSVTGDNGGQPMTLASLQLFLEECEAAGIHNDAVVFNVRTTFSGKLRKLSADTATAELDR